MGGCKGTEHGCCPDGITAADGPDFLGCPAKDAIPRGACLETEFGCCHDGILPAQGPFNFGCPEYTCVVSTPKFLTSQLMSTKILWLCCFNGHTRTACQA